MCSYDEFRREKEEELQVTYACPVCGVATPHHHTPEEVQAYNNRPIGPDGL